MNKSVPATYKNYDLGYTTFQRLVHFAIKARGSRSEVHASVLEAKAPAPRFKFSPKTGNGWYARVFIAKIVHAIEFLLFQLKSKIVFLQGQLNLQKHKQQLGSENDDLRESSSLYSIYDLTECLNNIKYVIVHE